MKHQGCMVDGSVEDDLETKGVRHGAAALGFPSFARMDLSKAAKHQFRVARDQCFVSTGLDSISYVSSSPFPSISSLLTSFLAHRNRAFPRTLLFFRRSKYLSLLAFPASSEASAQWMALTNRLTPSELSRLHKAAHPLRIPPHPRRE